MPPPWRALRLPVAVFAGTVLAYGLLGVEWGIALLAGLICAGVVRSGRPNAPPPPATARPADEPEGGDVGQPRAWSRARLPRGMVRSRTGEGALGHRRGEMSSTARAPGLDAGGRAFVATDLAGQLTYWSRGAERLYGWRADEVRGCPI